MFLVSSSMKFYGNQFMLGLYDFYLSKKNDIFHYLEFNFIWKFVFSVVTINLPDNKCYRSKVTVSVNKLHIEKTMFASEINENVSFKSKKVIFVGNHCILFI